MKVKNLTEVSKEEQKQFLDSFKYVLSDMDGVIWLLWKPIPGAAECFKCFQKLDKKIAFVTNNNLDSPDMIRSQLIENNFPNVTFLTPGVAILEHLKSINFNKTIYSVGSEDFKKKLIEEGFTVFQDPPQYLRDVDEYVQNIEDDPNVGAVIFECDINLTRVKIQKAITFLKRPDCLFLAGACDEVLHFGVITIGVGHFYRMVVDFTGRKALQFAKPSKEFAQIVMDKLGIRNNDEVLFIGDSIDTDMGFAKNLGFKKLLVLSGNSSIDHIKNWKRREELKPEYYVNSLDDLKKIIQAIYNVNDL